jgi:hypothetical protein
MKREIVYTGIPTFGQTHLPPKKPMMVVTIPSNPLKKPADSVAKISWVPS